MSANDVRDAIEAMAESIAKQGARGTARGRVNTRVRQAKMMDAPPSGGWEFVPDTKKEAASPLLTPARVWACVVAAILLLVVGLAWYHRPDVTDLHEGGEVVDEEPVFEVGDEAAGYDDEEEEAPAAVADTTDEESLRAYAEANANVKAERAALPWANAFESSRSGGSEADLSGGAQPDDGEPAEGEPNMSEPAEDDGSNATLSEAFTQIKAPELYAPGCIPKHVRKTRNGQVTIAREVVQYTINAIKSAPVETKPYEHVYVKSVFEPAFYKCVLSHIPAGKDAKGLKRLRGSRSSRFTIPIARGKGFSVDDDSGAEIGINTVFWNAFSKAFGTAELSVVWLEKFKRTTSRRFRSSGVLPPWAPGAKATYTYEMDLSRDLTGYAINPHTDSANKLVTTLFYLPKTDALANTGTLLVKSRDGKVAKQAQFVPNSLMAFAPCMSSWHAVKKTTNEHHARDSIQGFVHINSKTALKKGQCTA